VACGTYVLETHGTPLHGKRVAPELVVWAVGALAEGLGIRAVARVFKVDPNTVLQWLVEAADHAAVLSRYFLQQQAILKPAGLALVRITDHILCVARRVPHDLPFRPGGEAGSAHAP
jgi:hypothetical protein